MIPRKLRLTGRVAAALVPALMVANAWADQLEDARLCTREPQRLERLACFDEVFGTPLAAAVVGFNAPDARRSERWRQAYARLDGKNAGAGVLYRDTGKAAGQLVTVPALGVQPPRPLLALQCHNNITELTLMLPEAMDQERVQLGFGREQTVWRVRDTGLARRCGRGPGGKGAGAGEWAGRRSGMKSSSHFYNDCIVAIHGKMSTSLRLDV